jgi:hypothetical protein
VTLSARVAPEPNFSHLIHMTDVHGTFEHALNVEPRPEHGYCTDDMARVLVVASRESNVTPALGALIAVSLRFLDGAIDTEGRCRNRMNRLGGWDDRAGLDDCWGRALWGLGSAISRCADERVRLGAIAVFERASVQRSLWPRATAFAALGAADLLGFDPGHGGARELLVSSADMMADLEAGRDWVWPESRLTYANAVLPEAMIAAGSTLDRPELLHRGLGLLEWLLDRESVDGHLSVTPAGGAGPTDRKVRFDQQPIEVAAMADACARAARIDGDQRWLDGVESAVNWFLGHNDRQIVMWDESTGGGFDGLEAEGANQNQGTESTLAFLSTMQHARSFLPVGQ